MIPSRSEPEARSVDPHDIDVLIVGCGAAGLSAAVSAKEQDPAANVVVLERSTRNERGGNTRWSSAYFRMTEELRPADGFDEDFAAFTGGAADPAYVSRLRELSTETLRWLESHGVRFEMVPMFFLTARKPRLGIAGGGAAIVDTLGRVAEGLGVEFRYETTVDGLLTSGAGSERQVTGVHYTDRDGRRGELRATAVLLASGGYEGNVELMRRSFGENAEFMKPVARGGSFNQGELIESAIDIGAARAGEWGNFHGEPVDPRSHMPEAVVMTFPYGILVNADGERFVDEASGTVDEIYEEVCRSIFRQPGNIAYLIADQRLLEIPDFDRATLTDQNPYQAESLEHLAKVLDVDARALTSTVDAYNRAVQPGEPGFDHTAADGLCTIGLQPPKSNWARAVVGAPFVAIPIATAVCFTFGGVAVDQESRVLTEDGMWIRGLWAAGEMTGVYHRKYPGATSVLRSLVFGRVAARGAMLAGRAV
ncbi:tricarballylate dehydrogenase [Tamaricihabitans halophyticus]|uniref:Tricarballylate dehydrogenase n=1 Tax=Tamaricihabitans halophyticus TaxID=1262583 RepID=A0A4R2R6L0_9PSEU|nr:FAD-dependent oxidoreductase [Tamaricihabitans halophyticus]TCP55251.1 tricarballylate dehydrogenase [Tamaricihabitans halophyticus]